MRRCLTILFSLLVFSLATPAAAQVQPSPGPAVQKKAEPAFAAGDIDFLLSLGFGGFLYPHIEPGLDVGIIPIGDMSISIGGGVDFGYCLLCDAISLAATTVDVDSFYVWPYARGAFHFGTLGGLLQQSPDDFTIDLYAAAIAGPSFYSFTITEEDTENSATATTTSVIFGPAVGARLGFADNTFLAFIEYRALAEIGFSTVNVEIDGTEYTAGDGYSRTPDILSSDFILGIGFRI